MRRVGHDEEREEEEGGEQQREKSVGARGGESRWEGVIEPVLHGGPGTRNG